MRRTVLISHDLDALRLAVSWAGDDTVTAVLLDGASAVLRAGHVDEGRVTEAVDAGVTVAVHDESLRRRGLRQPAVDGVKVIDLTELADLVATGSDRVVWL